MRLGIGQCYRCLASAVDLMFFFMVDFIVCPQIWQFAFLEFSYLLLSSVATNVMALTAGQYFRIHVHIHAYTDSYSCSYSWHCERRIDQTICLGGKLK